MAAGGVWVFRNDGVTELEQEGSRRGKEGAGRLGTLGWERYYEDRAVVQLHRRDGSADLISLPRDFSRLRSTHMYDVVVKNRHHFKVVDV
ncbi:hypothetical protein BRADI_3g21411v3 [Brachypodium distachyon]|uniref:Uncharacterized protein n=1 Tax=Brachypodium distachyon TaxID=15368 RepID=A0A0Q3JCX3_BRADI|nr:hypothetical protein BRADI_3g21411v3 [Brachypodium distachyon]